MTRFGGSLSRHVQPATVCPSGKTQASQRNQENVLRKEEHVQHRINRILAASVFCGTMSVIPAFGAEGGNVPAGMAEKEKVEQPVRLNEVTVTSDWLGAADKESVKAYPGGRSVVTGEDLTQTGARNLEDALRQVPGVRVQDESGTGILPNIGVRGLNPARSQRALVLVDGIPATLAPYGQTGLSLFPVTMETVESVDVVRGGAAVRFGPNNVGGVINFVSKPIPYKPGVALKEALTIAENGNVLTDTYLRAGGFLSNTFGLQLQGNTLRGDSFRDHSGTEVNNLVLDADWLIGASGELKGRLQYYDTDTELPGGLSPQAYEEDRFQSQRPFDRFEADTVRGHLIYNQGFEGLGELNVAGFAHTSSREFTVGIPFDPAKTPTAVQKSPREFLVYGVEPRFTLTAATGPLNHKITVGGRYLREESDQEVNRRNLATGAFTVIRDFRFETDALAAYANNTVSMFNERLKVTPGIRFEWADQLNRNNLTGVEATNTTSDILPGLDIGYEMWKEKLFLFGNVHKSLQPVQFNQITLGGDVGTERSTNYEAGARLTPLKELDATFTWFRFDFDNQIEFDNVAKVYRNLGEARHQGFESELAWRPSFLPGLDLKGGYTYVDTEQLTGKNKGKELPFVSRHQLALQGNYRIGGINLNLNGSYASSAYADAANTEAEDATGTIGKIPGYWLWNAQVSKDFRMEKTAMKAALAVNNMFDEDYYFRGVDTSNGRVPAPGRAVMLSLQMEL